MDKPKGSLISYFSRMVTAGGGINLAQGKPGFSPPGELLEILKKNIDNHAMHQYAPGNGNFKLVDLLQKYHSQALPLTNDNLLVVQGATEGIFLTFLYLTGILEKPFSVLSFDPVYESYPKLPAIFHIPFEYFPIGQSLEMDFEKLAKTIKEKKVKILFLSSPGNPLGKIWSKEELEKLITLSESLDFYIIYDAVYKDIYFDQAPFNPLTFNYPKLFYIDSFSKMLSITGWRIGYILTPKDHMEKIRDIHDYTGLSAVSILQSAIADYLERYDFGKAYTQSVRERCKISYQYLRQTLEELDFEVPRIQGGYFLWARLPQPYDQALPFARELYEKVKLGVVPGENFSKCYPAHIRMNMALDLPVIKEASRKLKEFFTK